MLTIEKITHGTKKVATKYPIKSLKLFGSYAQGNANENSDLDFLVEFNQSAVSLLTISSLKYSLEDEFKIPVDILHYPLPEKSHIEVGKVINIYGN